MLQHQPDPRPGAPPSSRAQWIAEAVGKAATRGVWHSLAAGVALAILVLAIATLYSALKTVAWSDVQATISGAGTTSLVCGLLFTAGSYLALVGYDLLALRHLGERRAGLATAAQASFLGQAFTYTLGFGLLTGGAIRMRIYSSAGMAPQRIAALVVFCAGTFWLGLITLGALALVASPDIAGTLDGLPPILNRGIGVAVLGALAAYLLWVGRNPRRIELAGKILALPGPATTFMAILLGAIDVGMAALAPTCCFHPAAASDFRPSSRPMSSPPRSVSPVTPRVGSACSRQPCSSPFQWCPPSNCWARSCSFV